MAQGAGVATQAETGDARTLTDRLLAFTGRYTSAAVAFSGGLDSTLVLWACKQALGDENTLAITSNSPSFPLAEAAEVERIVAHIGLDVSRQRFISTREMEVAGYYENNSRRCYYCKTELYREVDEVRQSEGIEVVFDGATLSDLGDFRPGQEAAREYGVVSPLLECSIDKPTARRIAKTIGLPVADKPASACLSSRIPRGV
ncbi:MAG: TIGR00268 family protein, partial [Candidatus Zixiibacteriota bacterium]